MPRHDHKSNRLARATLMTAMSLPSQVELLKASLAKAEGELSSQGASNEAARQGLEAKRCGGAAWGGLRFLDARWRMH